MSINRLIALGGRGVRSPVERYIETKGQMERGRLRNVQEQGAYQTIGLRDQQEQRAKDQAQIDGLAPIAKSILSLPEAERPAAYKQSMDQLPQYGVDVSKIPPEYTPEVEPVLNALMQAGGLEMDEQWTQGISPSGAPMQQSTKSGLQKAAITGSNIDEAGDSEYERHLMAEYNAGKMTKDDVLKARNKRRRVLEGTEMRLGEERRLEFGKGKEDFDRQAQVHDEYKEGVSHFKSMDRTIDEAMTALDSGDTGLSDTMLNQVMSQVQDDNVRAYAMYQQFDKPFGNLANRVTESIERFFTGKRSDAEKAEIKSTLRYFKDAYSRPKRQSMRDYYRAMSQDNKLDPFKVVPPESPEDIRDSKIISTEEKKRLLHLYYPGMFD